MGDITESRGLFQAVDLVFRRLALDHFQEDLAHFQRVFLLFADDHAEHDVRRRLRDGAAVADERAVRDHIAVKLQLEEDVVAAARVDALEYDVGVRQVVLELRMQVVLGENFIVKASIFHNPFAPLAWKCCQAAGRLRIPCYKTRGLPARWTDASNRPEAAARSDGLRGWRRRRSRGSH